MKQTIQKLLTVALLLMVPGANADIFVDGKPAPELDRLLRESETNRIEWGVVTITNTGNVVYRNRLLEQGFSLSASNGIESYLLTFGPYQKPWLKIWDRETNAVTVCLVTNVVEFEGKTNAIQSHGDWSTWTEVTSGIKYVTTIVTERKTLSLVWDGKPENITREREVSRTVRTFRKADEWREVKP